MREYETGKNIVIEVPIKQQIIFVHFILHHNFNSESWQIDHLNFIQISLKSLVGCVFGTQN
jgi:hypothetical protein